MLRISHIIILLAIIPLIHVQAAEQTNAEDKPSMGIQALIDKARGGNVQSQFNLGVMYYSGIEVEQDYREAVEWFTKAAWRGNAFAQFNLAAMYENGKGVEQDYKRAIEWYTKAAEQGDADSQFNLAVMYYEGEGVEQDYKQAVEWFAKAARQGVVSAQFNLAVMYEKGRGVTQNYKKAVEWYSKAVEQRYAAAQYSLALMYYEGKGVEQDYKKAVEWFTKAAEQGFAESQNNLAVMYREGEGVDQDYKRAIEWLTKAAEQENDSAQNNLAQMYREGKGVEQDYRKAVEWFTKAVEQENDSAQYNLAVMYHSREGVEQDYKKAVELYTKSAEQGNMRAQSNLGVMYKEGLGVEQDYKKAVECFNKSAEQGHAAAQNNLAVMYREGKGVEQDYKKAVEWFTKAAEQVFAESQNNLARMYFEGKGVEQDYKKAVELYTKSAEQGNMLAQSNLGLMYYEGKGVQQDYKKTVELYTKSTEQGHMIAQNNIAQMYRDGEGVEQDYNKALEWYTKAAILAQFDIESHDVIPFLPVTISGKKHLFIMDTGLSVTTFDKSLRKYLGKERGSKLVITPDKLMQLKVYDAPESFVGQMKLGCEEVLCSDFTMLSLVIGKKIGGVVGMDFLKHHIIQLDYDQGKVFFFKPKTNSKSEWGQEFDVKIFDVPIFGKAPHGLGVPYIDTTILDDMKIEFMIDTGSNGSIALNNNNFKRLMSKEQMKTATSLSETASGSLRSDMVRCKNFSIEPFESHNIIINSNPKHNLIGTGYLNRFIVTFDFPNRKVYFKEGKNFNKIDEADMSGLHILLIADNVVVHSVDPGSPAIEAGIKAKDTILNVNNRDANTYGMWELRELLTSGDKQKITMTIRSSDEVKTVSFLLKRKI